ncbi:chemotaxis protein CheW [Geobacillus thermoleovorans]|uniref:chemotaxis protein CheW n=1 Tax=Geobacillus thermoleovorans TaxID=33941 RepID=UPI0010FEAB69|nr:chemotaxis protein CheW [Geobacillus thermoleovorans]TLS32309.1 chemotaxis protein CheW [Geobacillus thermoleovorans]
MMKCVVIRLSNECFGIDIHQIRSIERLQSITSIPTTLPYVKGIINLRGNVIPIVDLRERLSMEANSYTDQTRLVVATVNDVDVGLIVDAANEVIDIQEEQIQPAPTFSGNSIEFLSGIAKLGDRVLILLDIEKLLNSDDIIQLEQLREIEESLSSFLTS